MCLQEKEIATYQEKREDYTLAEENENSVVLKGSLKDKPSSNEEKLTVTVITNKEPIIEKLNTDNDTKSKVIRKKPSCFLKIFRYFSKRRKKKKLINIPRSNWNGKVTCKIVKSKKVTNETEQLTSKGKAKHPRV